MIVALFLVLCLMTPVSAATGSLRISGDTFPDFVFQIPIGNIKIINSDDIVNGKAIALYIGVVYQWAVGFAAVLAVLAFTYAGVLWLIAGGDSGKVTESKKIMGSALIGFLLALGSYVFLTTINPNLVHFQPLNVPAVKTIQLNLTPASIAADGTTFTYAVENFTKLGFPAPNNETFSTDPNPPLKGAALERWAKLKNIAGDVAGRTGIDVGFLGMWMWIETGFDMLVENCNEGDDEPDKSNPNTYCKHWGKDKNWQVAMNHVTDAVKRIKTDMQTMYGSSSDAQMREIGKAVLARSKNHTHPITIVTDADFDGATLDSIITDAKSGDLKAQTLFATLMKDEKLAIYEAAMHFKIDKGYDSGLAQQMENWAKKSGYYNKQKISNLIKAVYDADAK